LRNAAGICDSALGQDVGYVTREISDDVCRVTADIRAY
jgi:hypothetical protein